MNRFFQDSIIPYPGRIVIVIAAMLSASCSCIESRVLTETDPVDQIEVGGIVIQKSGAQGYLRVRDYNGDGSNDINVGYSGGVSINFPASEFANGVESVEITAFHFNNCRFEAYDSNNALVASADHTAGQSIPQTLVLNGNDIRKVAIIGSEIGITKICYDESQ